MTLIPHPSASALVVAFLLVSLGGTLACKERTSNVTSADHGTATEVAPPSIIPNPTRAIRPTATPFPSPTFDPNGTPSVPATLSLPAVFVLCEPVQEPGHEGPGQPVASVIEGSIVYGPDGCDADVDSSGAVEVRNADGSTSRVRPSYAKLVRPDTILWTPARGELSGMSMIMSASFLARDAHVEFSSFGDPVLWINTTPDGGVVLGSLTRRIGSSSGGLPVAWFLNGAPLRGRYGQVLAPFVASEIHDTLVLVGLVAADANRLVDLLNNGQLR